MPSTLDRSPHSRGTNISSHNSISTGSDSCKEGAASLREVHPSVYAVLLVQRLWANAGLPSNLAGFPLLSGYQGNSITELSGGQILLQKAKRYIIPLPTTNKFLTS